ncbi:prenyltransferase [Candidatus Latescibacterota bacterium]
MGASETGQVKAAAAIFGPMRLPFLILTPACVVLGAAAAWRSGIPISPWHLALALVGGILAHIAVNSLNEFEDFRSGLDLRTERTPFSGGSGVLPAAPERSHYALYIGLGSAALVLAIGLYFAWLRGRDILPLGLIGLVVILSYTRWITRSVLLCLIAPGLGFGTLMVMGTEFALTGQYTATGLAASFVPFFLVSDLLLINQFPDTEADRSVGRRHLLVVAGPRAAAWVYALFLVATYATVVLAWLGGLFPALSLISLITLVLAVPTAIGALRHGDDIPALIPHLGRNVLICIATPVLLAAGLYWG